MSWSARAAAMACRRCAKAAARRTSRSSNGCELTPHMSASAEDRALFRDSARQFLADTATGADVRRWMATDLGYDAEIWQRVAGELGWPAVPVPEDYGGLGLGLRETALLMEEMGAACFCSPFLATIGLGASALIMGGTHEQKDEYLP